MRINILSLFRFYKQCPLRVELAAVRKHITATMGWFGLVFDRVRQRLFANLSWRCVRSAPNPETTTMFNRRNDRPAEWSVGIINS